MNRIALTFFETSPLDETSIKLVQGTTGLYFIFLEDLRIAYPFKASRLIYIGMSESKHNSIGNRLRDHKTGQSGNLAIANYTRAHKVRFTHLSSQLLDALGDRKIQELEGLFLEQFIKSQGAYPICNNQSGSLVTGEASAAVVFSVDWSFFE